MFKSMKSENPLYSLQLRYFEVNEVFGIRFNCLQNPKSRVIKIFMSPNVCGNFVIFLQNPKHKDIKDIIVPKLHGNLI